MRNVWIWLFSFLIWSCGWNQKIVLNTDDCDNTCYEKKHYVSRIGYNIEVNNIMNQETKDALIDFQKKNNIEVGQLDFYTLEKLDLLFY